MGEFRPNPPPYMPAVQTPRAGNRPTAPAKFASVARRACARSRPSTRRSSMPSAIAWPRAKVPSATRTSVRVMEADWLRSRLESGRSIESIAREAGKAPSTVAYWVNKHELDVRPRVGTPRAARSMPRSSRSLVEEGLSIRQIASRLDRSPATVRHWLRPPRAEDGASARLAARTSRSRPSSRASARHTARRCSSDGAARATGAGSANSDAVDRRRREIKRDPGRGGGGRMRDLRLSTLRPGAAVPSSANPRRRLLARRRAGHDRSLQRAREEAAKCVLLCANCHAEVEGGLATIAPTGGR